MLCALLFGLSTMAHAQHLGIQPIMQLGGIHPMDSDAFRSNDPSGHTPEKSVAFRAQRDAVIEPHLDVKASEVPAPIAQTLDSMYREFMGTPEGHPITRYYSASDVNMKFTKYGCLLEYNPQYHKDGTLRNIAPASRLGTILFLHGYHEIVSKPFNFGDFKPDPYYPFEALNAMWTISDMALDMQSAMQDIPVEQIRLYVHSAKQVLEYNFGTISHVEWATNGMVNLVLYDGSSVPIASFNTQVLKQAIGTTKAAKLRHLAAISKAVFALPENAEANDYRNNERNNLVLC